MKTSIRYGLATFRMAKNFNSCLLQSANVSKVAGMITVIETGDQFTVAGSGPIYEKFCRTGLIDGYSGFGTIPKEFSDPDFDVASLRVMKFDETFAGMKYDVTDHNYVQCYN